MDVFILIASLFAAAAGVAAFLRAGRAAPADPELLARLDALEQAQMEAREKTEAQLRSELAAARTEAAAREREGRKELADTLATLKTSAAQDALASREESARRFDAFQQAAFQKFEALQQAQKAGLETVAAKTETLTQAITKGSDARREEAERLRGAIQERMDTMQKSNEAKLEAMQKTVDEKLQSTLEKRLGESFKQVSERLEAVHKGLGEMQKLSGGVDDLKRVMTNVKTRGVWGEVQLSNLLEQVLTPDQFERDFKPRARSGEVVEFAIKLPGNGDEPVYLPLDAKFHVEDYLRIAEAADRADPIALEKAQKSLESAVLSSARDIRNKYIHPPKTTDFAIMFLLNEGLYAEVLRRPGLADQLQTMRVIPAGPTTLLALLNSLNMGFKTLAIQKRSSEVWKVLGAVKADFGKFGEALAKVKEKLDAAASEVEKATDRHRITGKKMATVEELPVGEAQILLGLEGETPGNGAA